MIISFEKKKAFLFELHAEMHIVFLPVKLRIAPYWRDVVLFCFVMPT